MITDLLAQGGGDISSMNPPNTGTQVASASTDVAAGQRSQQKPTTPVIVNAPTTNTTTVVKNESVRNPKEKKSDTGQTLFARAT